MARRRRYQPHMFADPGDVADFARGLSKSKLDCRERGHYWKDHSATMEVGYVTQTLICGRCKTLKHRTLTFSGEVLSRSMTYPDGYVAKGLGRIAGGGRDALRREALARILPGIERKK